MAASQPVAWRHAQVPGSRCRPEGWVSPKLFTRLQSRVSRVEMQPGHRGARALVERREIKFLKQHMHNFEGHKPLESLDYSLQCMEKQHFKKCVPAGEIINGSMSEEADGRSYRRTGSLKWLEWKGWNSIKPHIWLWSIYSIPAITMSPSFYIASHQTPLANVSPAWQWTCLEPMRLAN